jgi:hypothetical protein
MSSAKACLRDPPDWPAIRRQYEGSSLSMAEIARRSSVSVSSVRRRRDAEGWTRQAGLLPEPPGARGKARRQTGGAARARPTKRQLIRRLLEMVDRNLKLLELRMTSEDPGTASDRERDTRTIGTLTRTLGKITELQSDLKPAGGAKPKSSAGAAIDDGEADRLRLEIAERILRLRERSQPR